jgi:nucleoside-diphosphate-sugar epimerase
MKVALTGSTGFVGKYIQEYFLSRDDIEIVPISRSESLEEQLRECIICIHCAGLAHSPEVTDEAPYMKANLELTQKLAEACKNVGVEQFIFLSTIKVLGEYNQNNKSFDENSPYDAHDFYAKSKQKAEEWLMENWKHGLNILRPVVVYGKDVKGNFKTLNQHYSKPFPFGGIKAKRSIIYAEHLVSMIEACFKNKDEQYIFNCADDEPLSIGEIIKLISKAHNKKSRVFWFPEILLKYVLMILNKDGIIDRLMRNYIVTNQKIKQTLEWRPIYTTEKCFELSFSEKE